MLNKIILTFVLLSSLMINAQVDNIVKLTVSGTGKTIEEAKNNALRSAIEQAFGAFISSKTEILNNEIVKDEIVSVSNGNIQKYDIVSQVEIPNIGYSIIVNTIVSISKLTSFAQSKGVSVEIKGGIYALNIKQQLLNEESEINSISQIFGQIHELLQNSFDYKLIVKEPQSINSNSQNWKIPITVEAYSNKNVEIAAELLINSLSSLSLTKTEVEIYKNLDKKLYLTKVKYKDQIQEFYLRKPESLIILQNIESNWFFYNTNFIINNNYENIYLSNRFYFFYDGYPQYRYLLSSKSNLVNNKINLLREGISTLFYLNIHPIIFDDNEYHESNYKDFNLNLNLINSGIKSITLELEDLKSLQQLETLETYQIKNAGTVLPFKYGGYIYEETTDKISIVAPYDIISDNSMVKNDIGTITPDKYSNWIVGTNACKNFKLNHYSDWKTPTLNDIKTISQNLFFQGVGCVLGNNGYWSSEEKDTEYSYFQPLDISKILESIENKTSTNSSITRKSNFYSFGLSLKMRPVRYVNKIKQ